jgi:hypothetical protein
VQVEGLRSVGQTGIFKENTFSCEELQKKKKKKSMPTALNIVAFSFYIDVYNRQERQRITGFQVAIQF